MLYYSSISEENYFIVVRVRWNSFHFISRGFKYSVYIEKENAKNKGIFVKLARILILN